MVFIACGLNHKTAPLDLREKMTFPLALQSSLLSNLVELPTVNEAAILSTCNRTEIYCDSDDSETVVSWLADEHQLQPTELLPYLYIHHGQQGIRHTLRVASGLDSMMLGEPQILGQMKQAYQHACEIGTVKTNLRQVFQYIFRASKRIRSHSGIGSNPVSIAYAAVQLISQSFPDPKPLRAFIIGSGETAMLVAKYLFKQGVRQFFIASRTSDHAKQLAIAFNGQPLTIADIPQYLSQADVVISATACPLPFINKGMMEHALSQRAQKPVFLLDLAVPRDIEADVASLDNIQLYNIDDLQHLTLKGMDERRTAALQAEQLIDCELDNYIRWHRSLRAKETICNYRNQMQDLAKHELQRAKQKLIAGHNQEQVLAEFGERLINKLTHYPSIGLRQAAWEGREELFDLIHYLFNNSLSQISYEEIS